MQAGSIPAAIRDNLLDCYRNQNDSTYTPATNAIVKVLNKAGTQLPSTGGIGTTLFYVIGGGLMAVAAVLLVTKKRMNNK